MNLVINFFIRFIILFIIFTIFYLLYYKKSKSDYSKLKKDDYIKIFIARYNLDMRKTEYKDVLNIIMFNNAFILAFTSSTILVIKNYILKIAVSFMILFALIVILYEISGRSLKKKESEKHV